MHYSPESTILPTNASDLLEWAAEHIDARGFHFGHDGSRFGHDGSTTRTALLRPGILGALDVAGGDGRQASTRVYDYPAIHAARRLALDLTADLVSGGAVRHDPDWVDQFQYRRYLVHAWGMQTGRTGAEAADLFRRAAGHAERAAAAATRPGRPPQRLYLPTAGDVLTWAAAHIEDAGHRPGTETHAPDGYAGSAACTMLHALDRAVLAAKPDPGDRHADWEAYRNAGSRALRLVVEEVTGGPVDADSDARAVAKHLRGMLLMWGDEPGRSTAEVAAVFRAAVPDEAHAPAEEPVKPGPIALF
ncbi:DUF6197 family protein [Streptomyces sp. YIM S03343]